MYSSLQFDVRTFHLKQKTHLFRPTLFRGPETIPSDHLSALREQWRSCVEEWLWRQMFSDRASVRGGRGSWCRDVGV